jgi:glycine/D-amino acid oxidase-like deaminating enzyme
MNATPHNHDAIVIGGGFYGAAIAIYLAKQRGLKRILLVEKESGLLRRASYNNQARVHNGYHYPRSLTTAYRSRVNFPKFVRDWPETIQQDFTHFYAIARRNSKVTAKQFERFCREIGAKTEPADSTARTLFNPHLIENVFKVEEYAFNATKLANWAERELYEAGVQIRFATCATNISHGPNHTLQVVLRSEQSGEELATCCYIFNCTYSGLNHFAGDFNSGTHMGLKQEIAEMALMKVPAVLQDLGITVMDGPFFSMIPFPARELHTLSHVRYTPHLYWKDERHLNPYEKFDRHDHVTRADRMVRDVGRYLPAMLDAKYIDSLFEVKTVLIKSEGDDSRPILFEKHATLSGCYSVLGGKIDNIYDVLEKLEDEDFRGYHA